MEALFSETSLVMLGVSQPLCVCEVLSGLKQNVK